MPIENLGSPSRDVPSDDPLERIAELLGCSSNALKDGADAPIDIHQMRELIVLWGALSETGREHALTFMRRIAGS